MTSSVKASAASSLQSSSVGAASTASRRWCLLALLALCGGLFFFRLGDFPLFDLDEPRYAEAAREMIESGNWITPHFNYELRFDKPVFFYWMIAWAYQWFGVNEFSARFFSALTATVTVLAVYGFARFWQGERFACMSALILSTAVLFIGIARMSITDMTLACFMTLTTLSLFMAAEKDLRWWLVAGVGAGLSMLTKGPVGLVVPGAILTVYVLITGQWKRVLLSRWLGFAVALSLLIALPWYWLCYRENGQIFLDALVLHNFNRYSGTVSGHSQPMWFYVVVLLAGGLPWSIYLPGAIRSFWRLCRTHQGCWQAASIQTRLSLFSAVWMGFVLVFFSLAGTKLATYILPLFPALALFVAAYFDVQAEENAGGWRWLQVPAGLLLLVGAVGGLLFFHDADRFLPTGTENIAADHGFMTVIILFLLALIAPLWCWMRRRVVSAVSVQAFTLGLVWMLALVTVMPTVSDASQGVTLGYLKSVGDDKLILFEMQRPSLTFYGRRKVERVLNTEGDRLAALLASHPSLYVITKPKHHGQLQAILPPGARLRVLENGAVYSLLSIDRPPSSQRNSP